MLVATYRGRADSAPKSRRRHGELSHIDITVHCNRPRGYRFFIYNLREERDFPARHRRRPKSRIFSGRAHTGSGKFAETRKYARPRNRMKIASYYRLDYYYQNQLLNESNNTYVATGLRCALWDEIILLAIEIRY